MDSQLNSTPSSPNKTASIVFLTIGYFISFFLYYIDEGNYHFKGLANPAEWIFVTMYALVFMGAFWFIYSFLRKTNMPFFLSLMSSVLIGILVLPLLLFVIVTLFRIF